MLKSRSLIRLIEFDDTKYILGLILFCIFCSVPIIKLIQNNEDDQLNLIMVIIGFFTYLIVDRLDILGQLRRQKVDISKISDLERSIHDLISLEQHKHYNAVTVLSGDTALRQITEDIKRANVLVNVGCIDISGTSSSDYLVWLSTIDDQIQTRSLAVNEIFFTKTTSPVRFAKMKEMNSRNDKLGAYNGYFIDTHNPEVPIELYTMIFFPNEVTKVYYGWSSGTDYSLIHNVYLLINSDIAEHFTDHYIALKRVAIPIEKFVEAP